MLALHRLSGIVAFSASFLLFAAPFATNAQASSRSMSHLSSASGGNACKKSAFPDLSFLFQMMDDLGNPLDPTLRFVAVEKGDHGFHLFGQMGFSITLDEKRNITGFYMKNSKGGAMLDGDDGLVGKEVAAVKVDDVKSSDQALHTPYDARQVKMLTIEKNPSFDPATGGILSIKYVAKATGRSSNGATPKEFGNVKIEIVKDSGAWKFRDPTTHQDISTIEAEYYFGINKWKLQGEGGLRGLRLLAASDKLRSDR